MKTASSLRLFLASALGPAACIGLLSIATPALAAKDVGPAGACDSFAKGSPDWSRCIAPTAAGMTDEKLFYAGYWLARLGRYEEAVAYLAQARNPDARTLTYLGFATRKAGRVQNGMVFYREALALDPDFVVARAYLGEAHLQLGALDSARSELSEIARRCGANCAAYGELARNIARFEQHHG